MFFNIFKSSFKDESDKKQLNEFLKLPYSEDIKEIVKNKRPQDKIDGVKGEFGKDPNNPIPVNGPIGTIKYLSRLRSKNNEVFTFHRIGSVHLQNQNYPIDCYELLSIDGKQWEVLFFDIYWPRRSRIAPKNCNFSNFHPEYSTNIVFSYGVNQYDPKFPMGVPEMLESISGSFGKKIGDELKNNFSNKPLSPPKHHRYMIYVTENRIVNEGIDTTPRIVRYDLD